ncbi:fumarylacetoacetase [Sphingomonas sp. SRS2]|uniref:fumarylacetoacetase n=1 Tax=Sphingomonas sp. SRS2 TaxID=133190 RepID=UPI0006183F57|nr:fumarylacetoacetase [Sphingomonas sp. SRS2]KKC27369.1 fumarylacetoacetase [Sphingomonas sp. SRS2]
MTMIDDTHDPALTSWVPGADGHADFPIQNLPYGIFSVGGDTPRPAVAIGDKLLDLSAISGLLPVEVTGSTLNALFAIAPERRTALRRKLSELLSAGHHSAALAAHLHDIAAVTMHLPAAIGDYTDFYVGIHHANNIGRQFRPDNPLLPNYKYVPIGYHGRASSIRPSGVPLIRPKGQRKPPEADAPLFGPSARLDYELELAVWIGRGNDLGEPIPIDEAADHIAGFCLLNDWSARDFQAWEYQPLGPFLAKNFHSTISPWVVAAEALAPFRTAQPPRPEGDPRPLDYLWDEADQRGGALAIDLEVHLLTAKMRAAGMTPHRLSQGPAANMYWTVAQMVTHHSSNGCNLHPGDLLGTGTISAPTEDGFGSLMELSRGGSQPVKLPGGEERSFLSDGDEVILRAQARAEGYAPIGFGDCRAVVLPAR